jgi:hypothetical protein
MRQDGAPQPVSFKNKQLKNAYKQRVLPVGVFQIRNTNNDKIFLVTGKNLPGLINRHRFQLRQGGHPNKQLQEDWQRLGENDFAFEIVEELLPPSEPHFDLKRELEEMEDLWLAELRPFGERGYNQPKLTRAEKLRRIAGNGSAE